MKTYLAQWSYFFRHFAIVTESNANHSAVITRPDTLQTTLLSETTTGSYKDSRIDASKIRYIRYVKVKAPK